MCNSSLVIRNCPKRICWARRKHPQSTHILLTSSLLFRGVSGDECKRREGHAQNRQSQHPQELYDPKLAIMMKKTATATPKPAWVEPVPNDDGAPTKSAASKSSGVARAVASAKAAEAEASPAKR